LNTTLIIGTRAPPVKPRRVVFPFSGDSLGGSTFSALTLIESLDPAHWQPRLVVHRPGPVAEEIGRRGIAHDMIPLERLAGATPNPLAIAWSAAVAAPRLAAWLAREAIDVVHTNDLRMHLTWAAPARLSGRRFVWHARQILSAAPPWRALGAAASAIIAVSPSVLVTLPENARRKASVVPNPLPFDPPDRIAARRSLAWELGIAVDVPVIGFVGNLMTQKRPLTFLRMARRLSVAAHFVLAGDDRGGLRSEAETLIADLGIGGRVHFLGYRNPILPVIAACDVLVAPGVGDSFGRTVIEAMVAGTPVVASDSGGHRDLVAPEKTGLLFPPDDAEVGAALVARLLAEPDVAEDIARGAQSEARVRYSPATIASTIMAIYDSID